jgi:hypothetical protein
VDSTKNNTQRLAALVEAALSDAESRLAAGEVVSVAELKVSSRMTCLSLSCESY